MSLKEYINRTIYEVTDSDVEDSDTIKKLRDIVSTQGATKIGGVMVDMWTASAITQVYDKLTDKNKEKYGKLKIPKMATIAFKYVK